MIKANCVVLTKEFREPIKQYVVIGVFKNQKQAEKYLKWLDKDKSKYRIIHTSMYDYNHKPEQYIKAKKLKNTLAVVFPLFLALNETELEKELKEGLE